MHSLPPGAGPLARWLPMTQDRAGGSALHLTQQFLGRMLRVRRVGVAQAAGALQSRNLIGYCHGEIAILNRRGPASASCVCYAADRLLYLRTFD